MNTREWSVSNQFVQFTLDKSQYALPLPVVERVIRAVAITPLPKVPPIIAGIIDLGGTVIPVINIRERFGHPPRVMHLSDHLIVAVAGKRKVAIIVDETNGVVETRSEDCLPADTILPAMEYIDGVVKCTGGLLLIHDLDRLLSLDEQKEMDRAIRDGVHDGTSAGENVMEPGEP